MALIGLHINDPANRMTLKAMLELEGHRVFEGDPEAPVQILDDLNRAVERVSPKTVVLVLCSAEDVGKAVGAMRQGVYGYINVPFQPGEAGMMVQRAMEAHHAESPVPVADEPLRRLEEVESEHILLVLRRCKNNQAKAARVLGIGRNTLWRKLKKIETLEKTAGLASPD